MLDTLPILDRPSGITYDWSAPSVDLRSLGYGMPGRLAASRAWSARWSEPTNMNTWMTRARLILEIEVSTPPAELSEAVVRLPPRSSRWIAIYTGATGGQITRSTGLRDRDQALELARQWEIQARTEREARRAAGGQVRRQTRGDALMTHDEIAKIMGLSPRTIRSLQASGLRKLRRALRLIMQEHTWARP